MLKVTEHGVSITLTGSTSRLGFSGGLFWFASALMIGAVAVLMAMSILPERLSIGLLGLLVFGTFVFNWFRQRGAGESTLIDHGILHVSDGQFEWQTAGKRKTIRLPVGTTIGLQNNRLMIQDANGTNTHQVVGFESAKEAQVMQAVLEGQQLGKKLANIKMGSRLAEDE